ncbi:recombinase family protein [Methylorubrum zatmanii]
MKIKPQPIDHQDMTAVIYCRISSKKQEREGDGLASQETRLRDYCLRMGYNVVKVFRDKLTGSESQRPGLREMLAFVGANKKVRYRIVFGHLDRFTRDFYSMPICAARSQSSARSWRRRPVCSMSAPPRVSWRT